MRDVNYTRVTTDYKDYNYITIRLDTKITTKYKDTTRISKSYTKVTINNRYNDIEIQRYKILTEFACLCRKLKMLKRETIINTSSLACSTIECLPKGCTTLL